MQGDRGRRRKRVGQPGSKQSLESFPNPSAFPLLYTPIPPSLIKLSLPHKLAVLSNGLSVRPGRPGRRPQARPDPRDHLDRLVECRGRREGVGEPDDSELERQRGGHGSLDLPGLACGARGLEEGKEQWKQADLEEQRGWCRRVEFLNVCV